jgi:hypothetical protein
MQPTYADLTEAVTVRPLPPDATEDQRSYHASGVLHLPGFLPDDLIDDYVRLRAQVQRPRGWRCPTPYMFYREIKALCLYRPLMEKMRELAGEAMGLHLNLSNWVSTERAFHQDSYLNPEGVDDHYIAAWIALDDIHPASGPFQFVAGSNHWPVLRRSRIFERLSDGQRRDENWPAATQDWVSAACLEEITNRGASIDTYLPKRGDVLLWHPFLIHRGSPPSEPGRPRKSLIAHYSGISHRPDMSFARWENGEHYAVFNQPLEPEDPAPTDGLA